MKILKVPELLLREEQNYLDYIPKVVSIGPYHHGKPELRLAESVKPMILQFAVSGKEDFYYRVIRKEIINIRNTFEQDCIKSYSDDELAWMMLLDACFIMIHIETAMPPLRPLDGMVLARIARFMFQTLGMLTMAIVLRDMFLVENQIPFWILKLVLSSRYNEDEIEELLYRYLTRSLFGEFRLKRSSLPENKEELHLLEAFYRVLIFDYTYEPKKTYLNFINCGLFGCFKAKEKTTFNLRIIGANADIDPESDEPSRCTSRFRSLLNELKAIACWRLENFNKGSYIGEYQNDINTYSFRSATDLKSRGIHFKPSPTRSLKDVQFKSNWICGTLQLPHWIVSIYTKVFFLNMVAYELGPNTFTQGVVISYINLMESLLVRPEDVKELREKNVLLCTEGSDEQIHKMYQDIKTYGADNPTIFESYKDAKYRFQAHNSIYAKKWMAELIHKYFRSPWTFITLLAATALLVLTILQTVYTMKS